MRIILGILATARYRACSGRPCLPAFCGLLLCCLSLAACGGEPSRVIVFAMDGPPLSVAGERGELELLGEMAGSAEPDESDASEGFEMNATGAPRVPLVMVRDRIVFEGELERAGMVGNGAFMLKNTDTGQVCRGEVTAGPGYKGRIRGVIPCGGGEFFMFTLNHQGPDQGAGIGRFARGSGEPAAGNAGVIDLEADKGPLVLFFYHPSMEEAKRRLTDMQVNLAGYLRRAPERGNHTEER